MDSNTLSHELVARDEQSIAIFFSSFVIQFYLSKDVLKEELKTPIFINEHANINLFASQRVFIKNIISSQLMRDVCEEIHFFLLEYNQNQTRKPSDIFLSRINKAFLIRQIFEHSDQILDRYKFIDTLKNKDFSSLINMDVIYESIKMLKIEEKILVLARVFSILHDGAEDKKKEIKPSFLENIKRLSNILKQAGKTSTIEYANLIKWHDEISKN